MHMNVLVVGMIFVAGCLGGALAFATAALRGANAQKPNYSWSQRGLTIVIAGSAAVIFWTVYGPFACVAVFGAPCDYPPGLTYGQLFGSVLTG